MTEEIECSKSDIISVVQRYKMKIVFASTYLIRQLAGQYRHSLGILMRGG